MRPGWLRIGLGAWLLLLAALLARGGEPVRLHDLLGQRDVTDQYRVEASLARAATAPARMLAAHVASKDCEWLPAVVVAYAVWARRRRATARGLMCPAWLAWLGRGWWGALGVGLAVLAVGWGVAGHLWVEGHFVWVVLGAAAAGAVAGAVGAAVGGAPRAVRAWPLLAYVVAASMVVNGMLIAAPWPERRIVAALGADEVLMDLHVHTTASDGYVTPAGRVRWYEAQGVGVAAISDHHHKRGAEGAEESVRGRAAGLAPLHILEAQEYSSRTPSLHLGVIGPAPDLAPDLAPRAAVMLAKASGAFVILNHYMPPRGGERPFPVDELVGWGIDGLEIANGWLDMEGPGATDELRAACLAHGIACVSGSDEHQNRDLSYFMRVRWPEPRTVAGLAAALRQNEHQVVAVRPRARHLGDALLAAGQDEILAWMAWSAALAGGWIAVRRRRALSLPAAG